MYRVLPNNTSLFEYLGLALTGERNDARAFHALRNGRLPSRPKSAAVIDTLGWLRGEIKEMPRKA